MTISMRSNYFKNINRNQETPESKLCCFGYVDYIVLASTLSVALAEELTVNDLNILAGFFAVLSDELALIASVESCPSGNDDDFAAPAPAVAITSSDEVIKKNPQNHKKKKTRVKKVIRKKVKKKRST
ncbi:hypothetical protein CHL78_002515 [Romboutsia weinsteinii]|uniref:Uncharacterized protein n=1 Tax=Romboutsia weinsteinii TaxID=2020949 RepID=A0A371J8W2_9FIRM|nr:hypothetical protein [Romboutsia weinsteinii]RDY29199.1 hypothetical protein CHL78_002515 [Romboutsia weinsteinii]